MCVRVSMISIVLDRDLPRCQDDQALDGEDYGADDSDTYYVIFRKPEELMPPSCLFDNLDRSKADRYNYTPTHTHRTT